MREIKFRGFNKLENKFIYGYYRYDWSHHSIFDFERYWNIIYRVDKKSVWEYTWLKDKNEKEIYEGDIVDAWSAWSNCKCEVKYSENTARFFLYRESSIVWNLSWNNDKQETVEVIWNIYENPDLLEK